MDITNINRVSAFITKDGSEIRELLAHRNSCIRRQSLAEARLPVNGATTPHYHPRTEEIYGSTGSRMRRGVERCGHADSHWSYIQPIPGERPACPQVYFTMHLGFEAIGT